MEGIPAMLSFTDPGGNGLVYVEETDHADPTDHHHSTSRRTRIMADPQAFDITFTAHPGKVWPGNTWTCVRLPNSAQIFGTRGLVKVTGTIEGHPFTGAFMALATEPTASR